jgi:hypothetical protein
MDATITIYSRWNIRHNFAIFLIILSAVIVIMVRLFRGLVRYLNQWLKSGLPYINFLINLLILNQWGQKFVLGSLDKVVAYMDCVF